MSRRCGFRNLSRSCPVRRTLASGHSLSHQQVLASHARGNSSRDITITHAAWPWWMNPMLPRVRKLVPADRMACRTCSAIYSRTAARVIWQHRATELSDIITDRHLTWRTAWSPNVRDTLICSGICAPRKR